jgi:hypothetical protein
MSCTVEYSRGYVFTFGKPRRRQPKPMSRKKNQHLEPEVHLEPTPAHAHHVLAMLTDSLGSKKLAIEWMRAHAGCVVIVPSSAMVERLAAEVSMADSLEKDPSVTNAQRLSALHAVPRRLVSRAYQQQSGRGITARRNEQHCRHPRRSRMRLVV